MVSVAGVVVKQNGTYLLIQETRDDIAGAWSVPGGHIELGESPENAAIREGKEETGFNLEIEGKIDEFSLQAEGNNSYIYMFKAKLKSNKQDKLKEEIKVARWFSPEEIKTLQLRNPVLKKYLGNE